MKYAIIRRVDPQRKPYWEAHKYGLLFKLFGHRVSYVWGTLTYSSPEECEDRLRMIKSGETNKFEIIRIIKI